MDVRPRLGPLTRRVGRVDMVDNTRGSRREWRGDGINRS